MRTWIARTAALPWLALWAVPARAQEAGSSGLVNSFSQFLVAVSVLLVAVGFLVVLVKAVRLLDLLIARYEDERPSD